MYDFQIVSLSEKWFKESVPANYTDSEHLGTPCQVPSMVIDETNDIIYVCEKPDATTKNAGWVKYVLDTD